MNDKTIPFKQKIFYGWIIVAISALTLFFSGPGQTYSLSVFIDSYINEYNWSRSTVSGMYSLGTLVAGFLMGYMGRLFDKYGIRKMTLTVTILFSAACIWMSAVSSVTSLLIGFFLVRLLGQGSLGLSSMTLPLQWFMKRKGTAVSLVTLGGAASMALLPPFNAWIIQVYGWRTGWWMWAVLLAAVMVPVSFFFIKDKPEDIGLLPDNMTQPINLDSDELIIDDSWTLKEAMKSRSFWLIMYTSIVPSAIITGLIFHQISILGKVGLPPETAALINSLMVLARLPVMLLAGQIADRVKLNYLLAFTNLVLFASMLALMSASNIQMVTIYGVLIGVQMAFQGIVGGVIWPDYYGRRHLGSIRGVTMMAGVIGSALGPLPYGYAYDLFQGYGEAITASLIFPVVGILAGFLATKPKK